MTTGMKSRSDKLKRIYSLHSERMNATRRARYAQRSKHITRMKRDRRTQITGGCSTVCAMLETHSILMKDDPESLTTDFMLAILGRDTHER